VLPQLARLTGIALDFLFPQKCLGCGDEGVLLCPSCRQSLRPIVNPICPQCGRPQSSGILCPSCINRPSHIDCIRSPLQFEGLARTAIHQLKYKNLRSLAGPLGGILGDYLRHNPLPADVLVPVPLHSRRIKERGYNQSTLLALELSKLIHIPLNETCLVRTTYILPQAQTQSLEQRRENVRSAFVCRNSSLQDRQVLLIDDVTTSGATLDACAQAIKSRSATAVRGLTLAREI
jgi:ComF family protein